jgi:hypothetical protein
VKTFRLKLEKAKFLKPLMGKAFTIQNSCILNPKWYNLVDSTFSTPYWQSLEAALVLATMADFEPHLIYDREIYADHLFIPTPWAV